MVIMLLGMVTGLSLTRPCPAMERCDNTTADEEAAPQPAPSMPADNTLAPEPTLEKRQPKKNIPHARWTGRKMIDKVVTFFSDPPGIAMFVCLIMYTCTMSCMLSLTCRKLSPEDAQWSQSGIPRARFHAFLWELPLWLSSQPRQLRLCM